MQSILDHFIDFPHLSALGQVGLVQNPVEIECPRVCPVHSEAAVLCPAALYSSLVPISSARWDL